MHKRQDGHKFNQHEVTALKQHMRGKGHSFDFSNTRVLKREKNEQLRLNLEGLCILNNRNAINSRAELAHFEEYFSNR